MIEQLYALLTCATSLLRDVHSVRHLAHQLVVHPTGRANTCCFVALWPATPTKFYLPIVCGEAIITKASCFAAVVNRVSCMAASAGLHQPACHLAYQLRKHWMCSCLHTNLNFMHVSLGGGHCE